MSFLVDIRYQFIMFYHKYRKRRFRFEKRKFLRDYLNCFITCSFPINRFKNYAVIGNINRAKIIISCRYDTRKELFISKNKEYPYLACTHQKVCNYIVDISFRFIIIALIVTIIYFVLIYNRSNILLLSIPILLFFLTRSNYNNFSSTINLFLIRQLANNKKIAKDVAFVIYDKKIPIDIFTNQQIIIILDRCAYGNMIGIQTNQEMSDLKEYNIKILSNTKLTKPLSKYVIINTGFSDERGFYRLYIDTKQDTSLNISLYRQIIKLIEALTFKSHQL